MTYTMGSLFDGSGGFPLAATLCGITPKWAAEVEPYPIAVTRSRFPDMTHYGDVSKISGAEIEPVDIITFGSPCQDLSVAGKRAGLKHEANGDEETTRSGLFMEAVRIIKEMREATNGRYPSFALWENVPGAFSSNKGADFRVVLEELVRVVEPYAAMPKVPKAGWAYADSFSGAGWSLAYRVLDAQYWGVPQRRRRIHLVLDLRGERAREVLFEREGLRGYFAEGRTPWQRVASDAEGGLGADDRERIGEGATRGRGLDAVTFEPGIAAREGGHAYEGKSGTLRANAGDNQMSVAYGIDHAITTGGNCTAQGPCVYEDIQATLKASGVHAVAYSFDSLDSNAMKSKNPHSGCRAVEVSKTLDASGPDPSKNQGGMAVVETLPTCIMDSVGGNAERGWEGDVSPCLKASHYKFPPVVTQVQTATAEVCVTDVGFFNSSENVSPTLLARMYKAPHCISYSEHASIFIARRLTPTECARLQGFADRWGAIKKKDSFTDEEYLFWLDVRNTHAVINGRDEKGYSKTQMLNWYNKLHTDSAEYKMWGNGIALPTALYCMQGIAIALAEYANDLEADAWMD